MAFNGHQHDVDTIDDDQDGTPTKQPRSETEGPAYRTAEPDDEAVGLAGRAAAAVGRTSSSRARQRSDSMKRTRPRTYYILQEEKDCVYLLKDDTMEGKKMAWCICWKPHKCISHLNKQKQKTFRKQENHTEPSTDLRGALLLSVDL